MGLLVFEDRGQELAAQIDRGEIGPPFGEQGLESRQQPHAVDGAGGKAEFAAKPASRWRGLLSPEASA